MRNAYDEEVKIGKNTAAEVESESSALNNSIQFNLELRIELNYA